MARPTLSASPSATQLDLIAADHEPYGWTITCPQLPELVGGRDTLSDLRRDLRAILDYDGAPKRFNPVWHVQRTYTPGGLEVVVRWRTDHDGLAVDARRLAVVAAIDLGIQGPLLEFAARTVTTRAGEKLFIAALPGDRLRDVANQLIARADAATVATIDEPDDGGLLINFGPILTSTETGLLVDRAQSLDELGLTLESTVGEWFALAPRTTAESVLVGA